MAGVFELDLEETRDNPEDISEDDELEITDEHIEVRSHIVVAEVILPHFWVRPFCVVVSSSLWNPEVPGSNLGTVRTNLALHW